MENETNQSQEPHRTPEQAAAIEAEERRLEVTRLAEKCKTNWANPRFGQLRVRTDQPEGQLVPEIAEMLKTDGWPVVEWPTTRFDWDYEGRIDEIIIQAWKPEALIEELETTYENVLPGIHSHGLKLRRAIKRLKQLGVDVSNVSTRPRDYRQGEKKLEHINALVTAYNTRLAEVNALVQKEGL